MKKIQVFFIFLHSIASETYILVKGSFGDNPLDIIKSENKEGAIATTANLSILTSLLQETYTEKAFVFGWEDKKEVMVLYRNGTVVAYKESEKSIIHAICVEYDKPDKDDSTEELNSCSGFDFTYVLFSICLYYMF